MEDRDSQITMSALGQEAPLDVKQTWDPDFKKRTKIKAILDPMIPQFSVRMAAPLPSMSPVPAWTRPMASTS